MVNRVKIHQTGVSIFFKIRVLYIAWFEGFEFFIKWPYAFFHKLQVVFYKKSAHFMYFKYLWRINSVFAKCDLQSIKILKYIYFNFMCSFNFKAVNPRSLKSVLVLLVLAQILGPFGQTWVFHKFRWVFHKFTENGKFYIGGFLPLTAMIETPVRRVKDVKEKDSTEVSKVKNVSL